MELIGYGDGIIATMTTINNIADLVRILKEQPEWADTIRGILLSEELLELPARFAEFVQLTQESYRVINERLTQIDTRVDRLETGQAEGNQRLESLEIAQTETNRRLESLEIAQTETNRRLESLEIAQTETNRRLESLEIAQTETNRRLESLEIAQTETNRRLESLEIAQTETNRRLESLEVAQVETNRRLESLETDQAEIIWQLAQLNTRVDRLEGRFSNLEGSDYERKVRYRVLHRAQARFGLDNPYLALTQNDPAAPQFNSIIAHAIQNGLISPEQSEDLHDADIIISDEGNRHLVVEVSLTADRDDIVRAKRRAGILSAATGGTVVPAVITAHLNDAQRDQAAAEEVATFIMAYP